MEGEKCFAHNELLHFLYQLLGSMLNQVIRYYFYIIILLLQPRLMSYSD